MSCFWRYLGLAPQTTPNSIAAEIMMAASTKPVMRRPAAQKKTPSKTASTLGATALGVQGEITVEEVAEAMFGDNEARTNASGDPREDGADEGDVDDEEEEEEAEVEEQPPTFHLPTVVC